MAISWKPAGLKFSKTLQSELDLVHGHYSMANEMTCKTNYGGNK